MGDVIGVAVQLKDMRMTSRFRQRPTAWETYAEIENGNQQASDHSAVFIDVNV
jgi:hypothetical protein